MNRDDLIMDLIFSERTHYRINISDYIKDIYKYDIFIKDMKTVLKKAKVVIIDEKVILEEEEAEWVLRLEK